jgi:DNA modification methylase
MTTRNDQLSGTGVRVSQPNGGVDPRNRLNELTAKEWLPETVSVWRQKGLGKNHPDAAIERQHPAPFSFTDVSRLVRFFTKPGETVLDPFAGIGSTMKAAAVEGRNSVSIELSRRYVQLCNQRLESELSGIPSETTHVVHNGDARDVLKGLATGSAALCVTSPPYWNILHKQDHKAQQERVSQGLDSRYSENDARDLGNIEDYDSFLDQLVQIFGETKRVLTPKGHLAVVVGDFRHKSKYYMFHSDLAMALERCGYSLKGITVLYQAHKRIFPYGYPYSYVPNLHHQYILLLQNHKIGD